MKKLLFLLLGVGMMVSCGDGQSSSSDNQNDQNKEELAKLREQVMEAHDMYMPLMDDLYLAATALESRIEELNEADADPDEVGALMMIKENVEKASDDMMDWMKGFKKPDESMSDEEIIAYFNEQKELIEEIGSRMESSLEEAAPYMDEAEHDEDHSGHDHDHGHHHHDHGNK